MNKHLLCHDMILTGDKRIIHPNEIFVAVILQVYHCELQPKSVVRVGTETPLGVGVGGVGRIGKAWRLDEVRLTRTRVVGLLMVT